MHRQELGRRKRWSRGERLLQWRRSSCLMFDIELMDLGVFFWGGWGGGIGIGMWERNRKAFVCSVCGITWNVEL